MPKKRKIVKKGEVFVKNSDPVKEAFLQGESLKVDKKVKSGFKIPSLGILVLVVVFFILGSVLYGNKKLLIAGTVNGIPITSFEIYQRLITSGGKQMLDQIVVERLIAQEAAKKKIVVTEVEIDSEVKKVEESLGKTMALKDALTQQGMTLKGFRDQIKLRLTATKLIESKVTVTDEEINKYLKDNKDSLPQAGSESAQKEQVKTFLKEQKFNEEIQKLIQELKNTAKIISNL